MKRFSHAMSKLSLASILFAVSISFSFAQSPAITSLRFETQYNPGITEEIIADIYGDTLIVGIIPYQLTDHKLVATFATSNAESVKVGDAVQQSTITSNNFSSPLNYVVTNATESKTYKVALIYTGLPLVYVYTDGAAPILNKDDYVSGTVKVYPNVDTLDIFTGTMGIKGRGNTTWTYPKKPYRIKLGSAAGILGMPSGKDWVLLANYGDKSLMRNSLAYYLGANMNLAYTQRSTHVDLILNGVYQGTYVFGEHIKVDKNRLNIKELKEDDITEDKITGGYFLELDDYRDGVYFELSSGLPFVFKSPDPPAQEQFDYIKNYMHETEDAINSENFADPDLGYAKYINPETFIEYYWVSEVFKNIDAQDVSSIYYYKDRGQKLNMGPLWDFDVAAGNATVNTGEDPADFYVRESKWYKRLFQDPVFKSAAEARWATLRDELLVKLPGLIDDYAAKLELSQQQNFYKWQILDQPIFPSTLVFHTYENEVNYLKDWLQERIEWIDAHIDEPAIATFSLVAPANETRIFVSPTGEDQLTFSWMPSTNGSSYEVLFDTIDGDFTNSVAVYPSNSSSSDTTATIDLSELYGLLEQVSDEDSVTLKWTVHASKGEAQRMSTESFVIKLLSGAIGTPVLNSPTANVSVANLVPTLQWYKAYLADGYDVQVSSSDNFMDLVVDKTNLADTTYSITETLEENMKYYWRVRGVNGDGQGAWSDTWSFNTPVITGVGEVVYGVSLFPNPTSKELYIDIPSFAAIDNAELVDAVGRRALIAEVVPGAITKIDVSGFQRGMYVVILRGKIAKPLTSKIILR